MTPSGNIISDFKEKLITKGLEKSCESLGFFLKNKVGLEKVSFSPAEEVSAESISAIFDRKDIILYSEIMGDIKGICFFLLQEKDARLLLTTNFPVLGADSERLNAIGDEFLLELDNIITASVVTEFSNSLQVKMFGGIPHIHFQKNGNDAIYALLSRGTNFYSYNFSCRYLIKGQEFSPEFIWLFDSRFIDITARKEM
jgi:chemotaxis protein CheY-P-specific phosphatase CheC